MSGSSKVDAPGATLEMWMRLALIIGLALLAVLIVVVATVESTVSSADQAKRWESYLKAFEIIVISLIVAMLGKFIPLQLTEARQSFERRNEARVLFSRTKTGVDYLPLRLCAMNLDKASAYLQQLHVAKHRAQLYPEVDDFLVLRSTALRVDAWAEFMYVQLHAVRDEILARASDWDRMSPNDRRDVVTHAQQKARALWTEKNGIDLGTY